MRLMGGYRYVDRIAARSIRESEAMERELYRRITGAFLTSSWAVDSTVTVCGADPEKVFLTPNGANLLPEEVPPRQHVTRRTPSGTCQLLFVGREWKRKGGAVAVEIVRELGRLGIEAHLTVVGCEPPMADGMHDVTVIPFLDKNVARDVNRLAELYLTSDFFLLPTHAEAFGTVFAEAAAFGLPSVASDVGGISDAVIDGRNGLILPPDATSVEYAKRIAAAFRDPASYTRLSVASRDHYESTLNWSAWAQTVSRAMQESLAPELANRVGSEQSVLTDRSPT